MKAYIKLRYAVPERRAAFEQGLHRLGYEIHDSFPCAIGDKDIFLSWNRIGQAEDVAAEFEKRGRPVLITENASWGNDFAGKHWYTLARSFHNVSGMFPVGGPERWDSLGIELRQWRTSGDTVVLASRGIGPYAYRQPRDWLNRQQGRIRPHPGQNQNARPLEDDLKKAGKVVTWGSGAAIKALLWGIPVESHQPRWIGEQNNSDAGRLEMFRRLAHAQYTLQEISSGEPIKRLLEWK